jgi:hypothetical protein
MKVCPKCNFSYSDETLNFCLTDGVFLLGEEHLTEPESWPEAATLFDSDLIIHQFAPNDTSPNSAFGTSAKLLGKTSSFSTVKPQKTRLYLFPLLGVLATLLVVVGIFGWLYSNPGVPPKATSKQNQPGQQSKRQVMVPLTAEQENQVKKEATEFIERWRTTNEKKDIESHIAHYSNSLEIYYDKSGVDRNIVRSDRMRAYQRYDSISMSVDNVKISPESTESAMIVFDKSWTMKSAPKTSTGSVQQEVHISKQNGKWLIDGEKDLKVYYINNRENPLENSNTEQN